MQSLQYGVFLTRETKKIIVRGAAMANASLDVQSLPSMGRMSAQCHLINHTQHMHHTDHSSARIKQTLPLSQELSPIHLQSLQQELQHNCHLQ